MGRSKMNHHGKRHQGGTAAGSTKSEPKHPPNSRPHKKLKRERFWVEDCKETTLPANASGNESSGALLSLEVLITRSDLTDDYRQIPSPQKLSDTTCGNDEQTDQDALQRPIKTSGDGEGEKAETIEKGATSPAAMNNAVERNLSSFLAKKIARIDAAACEDIVAVDGTASTIDVDKAFICVQRARSAKKPMNVAGDSVEGFMPLPNGDCGDGIVNPHPKDEVPDKFWSQRRRLFTLFDDGIQLDKESWYSVTPETIAKHIAAHLVANRENVTILDPFCGCGGNAIAFAQRPEVNLVVCVDKDIEKLKKAACNAAIYNIPGKKMVFIHSNAIAVLSSYHDGKLVFPKQHEELTGASEKKDSQNRASSCVYKIGGTELLPLDIHCVFLSPPWGGMDYGNVGKRNYTLECIKVEGKKEKHVDMDGDGILCCAATALGTQSPVAYFLPRNINGISLGKSALKAGYTGPVVLEQNVLNGKLKTVTAYFGL